MSRVTEIAKAEAAEAEAEDEEQETTGRDDDQEAAPEPDTPPPPRSQAEVDAVLAQLSAEAERHDAAVRRIMAGDAELLQPCPACWTPGYMFPPAQSGLDEQTRNAILGALGMLPEQNLVTAADAQRCSTCNGYGRTLTGSRAPGSETKPCAACSGTGWTQVLTPLPAANVSPPPPAVPSPPGPYVPPGAPPPPVPVYDYAAGKWVIV